MSGFSALIRTTLTAPDDEERVGGSSGPGIFYGAGSPENCLSAAPGSIYFRTDSTEIEVGIYRKAYGTGTDATGWASDADPARWTDVLVEVSQVGGVAALTLDAFRDTSFNMYCMRYDQADELQIKIQFPHDWKPNTEVRPHLHCVPLADPVSTQTVALSGSYAWAHHLAVIPAATGWTPFTSTLDVAPGDVNKSLIMSLFNSTPTGSKESSILLIRLVMATATTTYKTNKVGGTGQANLGILFLDGHYQRNKLGTLPEVPT